MYTHLEDALDTLEYVRNHSQLPAHLRSVVDLARQDILEYIEEGYRMNPEETSIGD